MKFLADENVPAPVIHLLRSEQVDVTWIRDEAPGIPDDQVLTKAQSEDRILITFDKDFGDLACRRGLPASAGVILFRFPTRSPQETAERVLKTIRTSEEWAGRFSVVTPMGIRSRKG